MRRRDCCGVLLALGLATASPIRAQSRRPARIAWISLTPADPQSPFVLAFHAGG